MMVLEPRLLMKAKSSALLFYKNFFASSRRCSTLIRTKEATQHARHLIFFGSDSFSIGVFRELLGQYRGNISAIEACVVSKKVLFAKYLSTYHPEIPVHVWPSLPKVSSEDSNSQISNKFALVASFGKLIPESFISSLPNRVLNIHPSLLPRWRGAAPMPRCIMAGDLVVGVSVVQVTPRKFDVGKVLVQKEIVPNCEMKIDQLSSTLSQIGVRLLVEHVLPNLESAVKSLAKDQDGLPYQPTLARRLNHSDLNVDWANLSAAEIVKLFAATLATDHHHLNVTGQLRTSFDGHVIRLISLDPMPVLACDPINKVTTDGTELRPGRIVFDLKNRERLFVMSRHGWVSVRRLIFKKPMSAFDFHNGYLSKRPETAHFFDYKQ